MGRDPEHVNWEYLVSLPREYRTDDQPNMSIFRNRPLTLHLLFIREGVEGGRFYGTQAI